MSSEVGYKLMFGSGIVLFLLELMAMKVEGFKSYFSNRWNYVDLLFYASIFWFSCIKYKGRESADEEYLFFYPIFILMMVKLLFYM